MKRFLTAFCFTLGLAAQAEGRPNILFIFLDDFGWRDTGYMGSDFYETPNIDRLAKGGMVFTNAYSCSANCAPARACLLSGQYTPRHEIFNVGTKPRGLAKHRRLEHIAGTKTLRPDIVTWAESLQQAGYRTGMFGKWHLGTTPGEQGFDVEVEHTKLPGFRGHFGPNGQYLADVLTDKTIEFIEGSKTKPWCAYLSHYAVHTPIQAKPQLAQKYHGKAVSTGQRDSDYAAMIESVDDSVSRIVNKLDEIGVADNTVVFFFSDNGGVGTITSMAPLRGMKGMLYDGGVREPMIVRWPGHTEPGSSVDTPVISVDFYPTILEMAGVDHSARIVDGLSIVPLLSAGVPARGEPEPSGRAAELTALANRPLFWHFPAYLEGNRNTDGPWRTTPVGAVRQGDYKLIEFFEDGSLELYDLGTDIGETNDLAEQMPGKVRELHNLIIGWRDAVGAYVPTVLNPAYDPTESSAQTARLEPDAGLMCR